METATKLDIFDEIGVQPVINARGHATVLGGSTPSGRVKDAMEAADRYYVEMRELLERSGEIIAGLLECEAAYVTPGAAAALALGTAACITGSDVEKIARLPDTADLKNRVLIQKAHRYPYERTVTIVGTKLQDVGDEAGATAAQLEAALGPRVANVLYPAHLEGKAGTLSLDQVIEIAHGKGVPVLVDAAGQVYPIERFKSYTKKGADLVAFGSKYFGGVNSAGILCGKKELVDAAVLQGFIGFETVTNRKGFGRPLKLDRQEIVGVVVALQEWMTMDHDRRLARQEQRLATVSKALAGLPGVTTELVKSEGAAPRVLRVAIAADKARRSAGAVVKALFEGSPSIAVGPDGDAVIVNVSTVHDGDEEVVARRLRELLA
jgi:D-glucosaminate-6-phosphate ammonia-lyase